MSRLKEPSSWAGIAVIIMTVTGYVIPTDLLASGALAIGDLLAVIAAIVAIILKEKGRPKIKEGDV